MNVSAFRARLRNSPSLYRLARGVYQPLSLVAASWERHQLRPVQAIEAQISALEAQRIPQGPPVVILDTAIQGPQLTIHTAASRAAGWALRLAGQSVVHLVCEEGVPQCFYSVEPRVPDLRPPCARCTLLRRQAYPPLLTRTLRFDPSRWAAMQRELQGQRMEELEAFRYRDVEVGRICGPSVAWLLRRQGPGSDAAARGLMVRFLLGAMSLVDEFGQLLDTLHPTAVVAYNGAFFAEATAVAVARARGIRTVTHEMGWVPGRMFFSHDAATRYRIDMPSDFQMTSAEDAQLDGYLEARFRGNFKMGDVNFWPEIRSLSPEIQTKVQQFRQTVAVFTNVVFDTSQLYANVIFKSMFDWLGATLEIACRTPDTLFVIRVHPDEFLKETQDTVAGWFSQRPERNLPNVVLIPPNEYVSSYDLVRASKFVIVYNSTVGLEALILGKPVICGGETRYRAATAVGKPETPAAYERILGAYLSAADLVLSEADRQQARRYLYYTYFKACLDLSPWFGTSGVVDGARLGDATAFHPDRSPEMGILVRGIRSGASFVYA